MLDKLIGWLNWKFHREDIIMMRILEHQLEMNAKYETEEFKALPHIEKFHTIINDSIIPGVYRRDYVKPKPLNTNHT